MTPNRSSDQAPPVRTRAALPLALAAALTVGLAPAAVAAPLPATGEGPAGTPLAAHDSDLDLYVGGNYLVREAAAGAGGRIVTLGNFDLDKRDGASPAYRVGLAAGGSAPLTVGANLTVAPGERLVAEEGTSGDVVRYGGSLDGTVLPDAVNSTDATAPYADIRGDLTDAGRCYAYTGDARRAVTGQALRDGSSTTFEGDGAASLQIFSVDADLISGTDGGPTDISFTGIPDDATVLVNVYGDTRTLDSDAVTLPDPDQRRRLLWNFPDATALTLTGAGELEGSVLVGQPASVTTLSLSGVNGRFYTAGSLTHTSSDESGGQELHAYPFDGELPDCSAPSRPAAAVQAVARRADPASRPSLPDTGAQGGGWLLGGIATALLAAGTTLVVTARRARRGE
ncbi:choice-of-anchor A family protein [Streptomyces albidoflavus]|uniref:choice-of-anchor A family protein n=1 Tax=Streptomyces albidoflavus TaxID=1886 RepID=UPI0033AE4646